MRMTRSHRVTHEIFDRGPGCYLNVGDVRDLIESIRCEDLDAAFCDLDGSVGEGIITARLASVRTDSLRILLSKTSRFGRTSHRTLQMLVRRELHARETPAA